MSKVKTSPKQNFEKCAMLFKVMSNSKRLEILNIIKDKEITVNEISKLLGTRKSNTSQHLANLRYMGIVTSRRNGKNIYYKLVDPKIIEACKTLASVKIKNFLA